MWLFWPISITNPTTNNVCWLMINDHWLLVVCLVIGYAKTRNDSKKRKKKGQIRMNGTIKNRKNNTILFIIHFVHKIFVLNTRDGNFSLFYFFYIFCNIDLSKRLLNVYLLRANICRTILFFFHSIALSCFFIIWLSSTEQSKVHSCVYLH